MSGTAKPSSGLSTGIEVSSIINNYSMYDPAEFLFNQLTSMYSPEVHDPFVGTYVRSSYSAGSWFNTRSDWLDLTINGTENVNIWVYKPHGTSTYRLKLAVYDNPGGVKGDLITISNDVPLEVGWYKLFSDLPPGRYRFEKDPAVTSTYHVDTEWYIEESAPPPTDRFLIQDGSNIYTVSEGTRLLVGTAPVTEAMFQNSGMLDLTGVQNSHLSDLTNVKILAYDV